MPSSTWCYLHFKRKKAFQGLEIPISAFFLAFLPTFLTLYSSQSVEDHGSSDSAPFPLSALIGTCHRSTGPSRCGVQILGPEQRIECDMLIQWRKSSL